MKKISIRKLSFLSLVLLTASAVTAAIMPKDKSVKATGYSVSASLDDYMAVKTCELTYDASAAACEGNTLTITSVDDDTSITEGGDSTFSTQANQTAGSTSDAGGAGVARPNSSQSPC